MNRAEAGATLDTWREMLADDRGKFGVAVQALYFAALHFEAEANRLEDAVRADAALTVQLAHDVRDLTPAPQRPIKCFTNEADAIADARGRGQCVVFLTERPWGTMIGPKCSYWSTPIEAAYVEGVLRERWKSAAVVELDQAQAVPRPA